MNGEPRQPACAECGCELICRHCNDTRPIAEDLHGGWRLRTPLGTWETIDRTKHETEYSPVFVWTKERPDFAWEYARWHKVDAVAPTMELAGKPEVRFVEGQYRDSAMYVIATVDTHASPGLPASRNVLAQAAFSGRGKGRWVQAQEGTGEGQTNWASAQGLTKDQARAQLKTVGRALAKRLRVKFVVHPV